VCGVHTHKKYASGYEPDCPPIRYVRADRIEELEAKLTKAVDASVEAVWAEYTDSIESKWTFRKEHVQNAILRTLAELKDE
jgi:capsid protein